MGASKSKLYTTEQNRIAKLAKTISHPARVAILQKLIAIEGCYCGDLVVEIGLAQPTISQHLKELKNAGLIQGDVEGTSICYCINTDEWKEMRSILLSFLSQEPSSC